MGSWRGSPTISTKPTVTRCCGCGAGAGEDGCGAFGAGAWARATPAAQAMAAALEQNATSLAPPRPGRDCPGARFPACRFWDVRRQKKNFDKRPSLIDDDTPG